MGALREHHKKPRPLKSRWDQERRFLDTPWSWNWPDVEMMGLSSRRKTFDLFLECQCGPCTVLGTGIREVNRVKNSPLAWHCPCNWEEGTDTEMHKKVCDANSSHGKHYEKASRAVGTRGVRHKLLRGRDICKVFVQLTFICFETWPVRRRQPQPNPESEVRSRRNSRFTDAAGTEEGKGQLRS